jgi:hypothetical protein
MKGNAQKGEPAMLGWTAVGTLQFSFVSLFVFSFILWAPYFSHPNLQTHAFCMGMKHDKDTRASQ